jgi:hypothetical protein
MIGRGSLGAIFLITRSGGYTMRQRKPNCLNCKQFFDPHPSTRHHQRYCSDPACQKVRKAITNRRFRQVNPDYDKGPHNVERVRPWRQKNPAYWRREKRHGGPGRQSPVTPVTKDGDALQVVSAPQPVAEQLLEMQQSLHALQVVSDRQTLVFQGLAAQLTGVALQAELGRVLDSWYDRGSQLSGRVAAVEIPS